jgi:peptide/nickel transport system substrate-binding protein
MYRFRVIAVALFLVIAVAGPAQAQRRDLVIGMSLEPPHLDPTAGAAAAIDEVTYHNVFEGLTRIDSQGKVVPGLAESWEVADDGRTYTFHLERNVRFHDGTGFDSADVKFALDRARGPNSVNAQKGYFGPIESIETPDPYTVVIGLSRANGLFLLNMGSGDAVIVAPESADDNKRKPVGTGPFKFSHWVAGDRIELVRNPDFRDGSLPRIDRVTFRFISDPAAQLNSLRAGDVDAFPIFGAYESVPVFQNDPSFKVDVGTTEGETLLSFNHRRKPFDDIRVRRAICYALDREEIVEGAQFGYGTPIGSHFVPHRDGYVDLTGVYPHDLEKAKALLAEAGVANRLKLTLKLPPPPYARRSGEIVASQLGRAGIQVELIPMEWAQWLEQVFRGNDFDMTIVAHVEPLDIGIFSRDPYYLGYRNEKFSAVMAALDTTRDPAQRARLYGDAQRLLAEDAAAGFLFLLPKVSVRRASISGLWQNAPVPANDVSAVFWER